MREAAVGLARQLLDRMRDGSLTALEVRDRDLRVRVARDGPPPAPAAPQPAAAPSTAREAPSVGAKPVARSVTAPLTGIFYRSPSPQAPSFVQVGGVVSVGDVVGLIEAMKLFNEVRSTVSGRVKRIAAENGQLVRAHQPLVELE